MSGSKKINHIVGYERGPGASAPDDIEVVPVNDGAQEICSKIKEEFQKK